MTHAHVVSGNIVALGRYPNLEYDGERWWDLRDPAVRTSRGWLPVSETPRPAGHCWHYLGPYSFFSSR